MGKRKGQVAHQKARQRLRRRLRDQGVSDTEIARQVERLRQRQAAALRAGVRPGDLEAVFDQTHTALRLDDTGYRPTPGDPLLQGVARATGATAKAVRRRRTLTRYEHDRT
jgi:hypothetical protein